MLVRTGLFAYTIRFVFLFFRYMYTNVSRAYLQLFFFIVGILRSY